VTDTSHDIRTLNGLIATTIDSVDGYTEAAKDAENGRYAQLFTSRAGERRQVASSLQAEVSRLGAGRRTPRVPGPQVRRHRPGRHGDRQ
jgi:uncharacterized protein (TIGR02284 family)